MNENFLRISTITWFFNIFNKFEKNFLIKICIVTINHRKYQTIFLFDFEIQKYVFVDEKIVKNICETFRIIVIRLFHEKHFKKFDETKIKFVTHVIFFALIIQNHNELSISMFITKIEKHFIILKKFWINKHKIIIDEKNDFIIFKINRYDHVRFNFRSKFDKSFKKFWLSFSFKFQKTSFSTNFQKYQILQRKFFFSTIKLIFSRSIVKNFFDKKNEFRKNVLKIDVFWSLISKSNFFFR